MIDRPALLQRVATAFEVTPIVIILGPRQCGKTTLARAFAARLEAVFFDLEDPADDAALAHPMLALDSRSGLVVLDEVQRRPELFPVLRVLVDRPENATRYLLLGSASPSLVKGASESLAGRISFIDMGGFTLDEAGGEKLRSLWLRGGFPLSLLAASEEASLAWRASFIRTFLERDVPQLGISIPATTLSRFWRMVAHYHGQVWNAAALARSLGSSEKSARRYLEILEGTFLVRSILPWQENLGKRLVKAPKVFLRDSGLLHSLLGIGDGDALLSHPAAGASWEGFAMGEILSRYPGEQAFFYATHGGAELDLLLHHRGKRYGFEMKMSQAPTFTRSMGVAFQDLGLERLFVIYPGTKRYALGERAEALPLTALESSEF